MLATKTTPDIHSSFTVVNIDEAVVKKDEAAMLNPEIIKDSAHE